MNGSRITAFRSSLLGTMDTWLLILRCPLPLAILWDCSGTKTMSLQRPALLPVISNIWLGNRCADCSAIVLQMTPCLVTRRPQLAGDILPVVVVSLTWNLYGKFLHCTFLKFHLNRYYYTGSVSISICSRTLGCNQHKFV